MLGCVVYREDTRQFSYFAKIGDFDECQVDKSGRWLLIKENVDGVNGEDNRIIDLEAGDRDAVPRPAGRRRPLRQRATATWWPRTTGTTLPGAVRVWTFGQPLPGRCPPQGALVYRTTDWALDIGHISHANARPGVPARSAVRLRRQAQPLEPARAPTRSSASASIGSLQVLVVAPIMTDLNAPGGGSRRLREAAQGQPRRHRPVLHLDEQCGGQPAGRLRRQGAVPAPRLARAAHAPGDHAPPTVSITAPAAGSSVVGSVAVSATATDNAGVVGVQLKLDGANLGPEVTAPPFTATWNTTTVANGAYTLTAVARDAAGNTATSAAVSVTVANPGSFGPRKHVVWMNAVNATVTGSSLKKTAGCDGCADAGAVSSQTVHGKGYVEFTASETTTLRYLGFGASGTIKPGKKIQFAFALQPGGTAEVREAGVYRAGMPFAAGDVLRISILAGVATYTKNGALVYRSATPATQEFRVMGTLYTESATLNSVGIATK